MEWAYAHFLFMSSGNTLETILTPVIEALGYILWGFLVIPQGRTSVLRIYIDSPNGITIDDCAIVSRQVSALLDVEDPLPGTYTLEVSSPGLERPLFTPEHFKSNIGEKANIRLRAPVANQRYAKGEIKSISDEGVTLHMMGDNEMFIPFSNIARANLMPINVIMKQPKKSAKKSKGLQ